MKTSTFKKIVLVLIFIYVITGLNMFAPGEPTNSERFLVSFILVLGSVPIFLYIAKNESGIPFLPIFGAIYSIYYALPIFILKKYTIRSIPLQEDSLTMALALAIVGLFALLIAYYKIPGKSIGRLVPRIGIYWSLPKAKFWAAILGVVGLIFNYLLLNVSIPLQFVQIVFFLSELLLIAIGILFIFQLQGRLHKTGKILLWMIFLPSIFLLKLGSGLISQVLLIVIFLSFIYWYFRRKIPWKLALVTVLLFIFFSSVKTEFRKLTWRGAYSGKNIVEKSILFAKLASPDNEAFDKGYTVAANRIAHSLSVFAYVVDLSPKTIPYWMGQSYRALLWAPVPRVICPWKPTITLGQEFGHRYALLDPSDHATSWNFPQLVEMYVNFGVIGVIIGMFIMGIIYRSLYEMFCHPVAGEGSILIGIFIFTKLTNIESDFATVFGNMPYYIVLLVFINRLMRISPKK